MAQYPTKEEILHTIEHNPLHSFLVIETVKNWKKEHYQNQWSWKTTTGKRMSLDDLYTNLATRTVSTGIFWEEGGEWYFNPRDHSIHGGNPSILSLLHELGHERFGESELMACVFSVGVFREVFPLFYAKLTWVGHMLYKL